MGEKKEKKLPYTDLKEFFKDLSDCWLVKIPEMNKEINKLKKDISAVKNYFDQYIIPGLKAKKPTEKHEDICVPFQLDISAKIIRFNGAYYINELNQKVAFCPFCGERL